MDKRQRFFNLLRHVSEIISALWALIGSLTQALGITSSLNKEWQTFAAITVFVTLALWRMHENSLRIKPNIKVIKARPLLWKIYTQRIGSGTTNTTHSPVILSSVTGLENSEPRFNFVDIGENEYYFALVDCINDPGIRAEQATAKKVISTLRYYDEDGKSLIDSMEIIGRWWDEPETTDISRSQAPHTLQEVDISPSGKKVRTLVVAMKHKLEDVLFAYNLDSIRYNEWRKKEYVLGSGKKYVKVTIAGENVDDLVKWFLVYQNDKKEMKIEIIDFPKFNTVST